MPRSRSLAALLLPLLLTACAAPPATTPQPEAAGADQQMHVLTALLRQQVAATFDTPFEPAGLTEVAARLATLNERLDELLTRLSAPTGRTATTAAAVTDAAMTAATADDAGIELLREALRVNQRQRELCLENLANVPTPGFKKRMLPMTNIAHPQTGLQIPQAGAVTMVCTPGVLEMTDRNLDIAIDGEGWFAVLQPDGATAYTRDGAFHVDAEGRIVTGQGAVLQPQITLPSDTLELSVNPDGSFSGRTAGNADTVTQFGQIHLHRFLNAASLTPAGNGAYLPSAASGEPLTGWPMQNGLGGLKQGFLERSNVQVIHELVNLQAAERQRTVLRRALAGCGVYVR